MFLLTSIKATLSETFGGFLQRHQCTDFEKLCYYWPWDKINSVTKKFLVPTPSFIYYKNRDILTQFNKNDLMKLLWCLFSETRMHRHPENMFLLALRQDHFVKIFFLISTCPFMDLKTSDIFTQFNKSNTFRDMWWLFSETRIHGFPERMFLLTLRQNHFGNKKTFSSYSIVYWFQKEWYFYLIQ